MKFTEEDIEAATEEVYWNLCGEKIKDKRGHVYQSIRNSVVIVLDVITKRGE